MKKLLLLVALCTLGTGLFADKKLGCISAGQNVLSVSLMGDNTPVITYYEETDGLISSIQKYLIELC